MIVRPIGMMAPAPMPWMRAGGDQRRHRPGHARTAASRATNTDDAEGDHRLAAEDVGELAVDRHGHGLGQQVGAEQPGELAEAADVADHARDGGGDHRAVQGDQRGGQHDRAEDRPALRPQPDSSPLRRYGGRGHVGRSSDQGESARHNQLLAGPFPGASRLSGKSDLAHIPDRPVTPAGSGSLEGSERPAGPASAPRTPVNLDLNSDAELVRTVTALLLNEQARPCLEDLLEAVTWT